ncbi:hypothetical protein KJ996_00060 [Patescibacteria group bacterium]|nr:hypothetical protein [Patescibacteria group bacterium]
MSEQQSACDLLLERTTTSVWKKGEDYEQTKKVILQEFDERHAQAEACGTSVYQVELQFRCGGISKKCNCFYSNDKPARHPPCKHIIATAILWDEARGIKRPDSKNVEDYTIPPPLITRNQLIKAYDDPLNADLNILRLAADEFALSPRHHARLPDAPKFSDDPKKSIEDSEIASAFGEIHSWTNRRHYDMYFCAGEMEAAFCEVMRRIIKRASATPAIVLALVLLECLQFHEDMIMKMVDDSEGEYVFGDTHLDDLFQHLQQRKDVPPDVREKYAAFLAEYQESREEL